MRHFQIVAFLICSTGLVSNCPGQDSAKSGSLVRYSVKAGERLDVIVGVLLKSKGEMIKVFDLKTFSERTIDPKTVIRKKVPISESEAASRVGVASIVAWKLKDLIPPPPKPGKVAAVDGTVSYINLGKKSGIQIGSELDVFRGEDVIKDPETGKVLGTKRRKIAKVEVLEVRDGLSKVKLLGAFEVKLKIGDVVESNRTSRSIAVLSATNSRGVTLQSGVALADEITAALSKFKVSIVERTKLKDVISELALQRTGIFDKKTIQKVGNQIGAYAVMSATIIPNGRKSKVSVRLVEVETGKILYALAVEIMSPKARSGVAEIANDGSQRVEYRFKDKEELKQFITTGDLGVHKEGGLELFRKARIGHKTVSKYPLTIECDFISFPGKTHSVNVSSSGWTLALGNNWNKQNVLVLKKNRYILPFDKLKADKLYKIKLKIDKRRQLTIQLDRKVLFKGVIPVHVNISGPVYVASDEAHIVLKRLSIKQH